MKSGRAKAGGWKHHALAIAAGCLFTPAAFGQAAIDIPLSQQQVERLGVTTIAVRKADGAAIAELPARIVPARTSGQSIVAPFAGTVSSVHALAGQTVKVGDPVLSIASRDFIDSQSNLQQARAESKRADAGLARARQLHKEGLTSGAALESAEGEASRARAMLAQHNRFGSREGGQPGEYVVRAPASGRIAFLDVRAGEPIDVMQRVGFLSINGALWAEIQLPARLLGRVAPKDAVIFGADARGEILSVAGALDPVTRSTLAMASVPDGLGAHAGETLRVRLEVSASEAAFEAPSASVIGINGDMVVFVATKGGFRTIVVRVLGRTSDRVSLSGDLKDGMLVAARGLTELKAIALAKGE